MHKHSWILFAVIGSIGVLMTCLLAFNPAAGVEMLEPVGPPVSVGFKTDPFLLFTIRWAATALAGVNTLTVFIAATAFRRGEKWAGVALWYWPLMFASHLLMYRWGPMSLVQIMWLTLTIPTLVAHHFRGGSPRRALPLPA